MTIIDFFIILIGIPAGMLIGILPMIGSTIMLLILFPLLIKGSINSLIIFFVILKITDKFFSSYTTLKTGVITELNEIPIFLERQKLKEMDLNFILKKTGFASALSIIFSIIFSSIMFFLGLDFSILLRSEIFFLLINIFFMILFFWKNNKKYINFLFISFGFFLGIIGFSKIFNISIFTFGISSLYSGIPFLPIFICLYIIPILLFEQKIYIENNLPKKTYNFNLNIFFITFLGSSVGFLLGFIPIIGLNLSSNVAYYIISKITENNLNKVLCVESAISSSSISMIIPLLFFGIPVQPSEIILLNLLSSFGWTTYSLSLSFLGMLVLIVIFITIINYYLVININKIFINLKFEQLKLKILVLGILILNIFFIGYMYNQLFLYLFVSGISLLIVFLLKNKKLDFLPFIFSFSLAPLVLPLLNKLYNLYF